MKPVLGNNMLVDITNRGLEKDLLLHGIREKESTEIFRSYLEEGMKVVDVGANIGYYTLIEADSVGSEGKVMAIEPTRDSFLKLQKNCSINNFENVKCLNVAAGLERGQVQLKERPSPNLNKIVNFDGEDTTAVQQETLDNIVDFEPDIVRMDVEGYELEIIQGMAEILSSEDLKLFLELHPNKMKDYGGADIDQVWDILSRHDFKIAYLVRHGPEPRISYFFRSSYPPKQVIDVDKPIEEALVNHSEFFEWEKTFRVFLEK